MMAPLKVNVNINLSKTYNIQGSAANPAGHTEELPSYLFGRDAAILGGRDSYGALHSKLSLPVGVQRDNLIDLHKRLSLQPQRPTQPIAINKRPGSFQHMYGAHQHSHGQRPVPA